MSTRTWLLNNFDTQVTGSIMALPDLPLTIPAGGKLVRFQVRSTFTTGWLTGTQASQVAAFYLSQRVHFTSGAYSPRDIFKSSRGIPMAPVAVNPSGSLTDYYDCWFWGGDNEFGVDQRCSYGGPSKPAMGLTYTSFIATEDSRFTGTGNFRMATTFAALYES